MKDGSHKEYIRLFRQTADPEQAAAAIGEIYGLCERDFAYFLRSCKLDDQAAADLISDLMVELLLDVPKVAERENPKYWLFGILKNLVKQHFRVTNRMPTVEIDDYVELMGGISADGKLLYGEAVQTIVEIAQHLSPKRRRVFLMRFLDDLSDEEIAKRNGKSIRTVRKQLAEAIAKVCEMLRQLGYGDIGDK